MRPESWSRLAILAGTVTLLVVGHDHASRAAEVGATPAKAAPDQPPAGAVSATRECVLEAYAKLAAETSVLQAKHAGDPAGFAAAHAARKKELVGQAALETTGCTAK